MTTDPRSAMLAWTCLDTVVWNVGHGSAASVRLPNGAVVMLDCGPMSDASSSPALATLRRWGRVDALIVSHSDMDHIGDICNMAAVQPPFLVAPPVPAPQILDNKNEADRRTALSYLYFKGGYAYCILTISPASVKLKNKF